VIAAYNAGPATIAKDRPLRLETLQYVINVGYYRWILRLYEPEIRSQAQVLRLRRIQRGESWDTLARATGIPASALRLYNPFLAVRPLQAGSLIAYPPAVPVNLLEYEGDEVYYTSRIGDSCLQLALVFGIPLETFRAHNDLWPLQQLPAGVRLRLALPDGSPLRNLQGVSEEQPTPEPLIEQPIQSVFMEQPRQGQDLPKAQPAEATPTPTKPSLEFATYEVQKGDTLDTIARRYSTTVRALRHTNNLRHVRLKIGTALRIPGPTGRRAMASPAVRSPPGEK
jgi:LysM repeat protein